MHPACCALPSAGRDADEHDGGGAELAEQARADPEATEHQHEQQRLAEVDGERHAARQPHPAHEVRPTASPDRGGAAAGSGAQDGSTPTPSRYR